MATFTCRSCQQSISVADKNAGRRIKCPKCGAAGHVTPEAPPLAASPQPIRAAAVTTRTMPGWASMIIALVFALLGVLTIVGAFFFLVIFGRATSAIQEAAAAACFSTLFIAGYITARSVEKFLRNAVGS